MPLGATSGRFGVTGRSTRGLRWPLPEVLVVRHPAAETTTAWRTWRTICGMSGLLVGATCLSILRGCWI
jgi:hypothetical protein